MSLLRSLLLAFALLGIAPAAAQETSRYMPPSTATESSRVICPTACVSTGFQVNSGATALWIMVFDATAAPADGAGQTPVKLYQLATNSTLAVNYLGLRFNTGMVIVCSSTGPFTKTASSTCQISGDVR